MKEFTKEMLDKLIEANESVKGTVDYLKYYMECDWKYKGSWRFQSWSIPNTTGKIKTVKDKTYIITEYEGIFERYPVRHTVERPVRELLGI